MGFFKGKSVLITGGTGSFGKSYIANLLQIHNPRRIIIFSRDEMKQFEMKNQFGNDPRLRFFIGDIRDKDRLNRAFIGVDYVVHAAALKQVDTGEYNPREFILTNIVGSQNIVDAAIDCGVKKVIALSTDKASSPINLYGATKLTADKLFVAANVYGANTNTKFSVVRYGNVMGSRGSVIPFFLNLVSLGQTIPVTDLRMTRFWITLKQAVNFVDESFKAMKGGELFIPRIPSMKITDLITAINPGSKIKEIGIRAGEKLHEEMISPDDGRRTIKLKNKYILLPGFDKSIYRHIKGERVPEGFSYRSDTNDLWLTPKEIRIFIKNNNL